MDGGEFLTLQQVATRLGVSDRTVRRLVHEGKLLQPVKVGGSPRWYEMDVTVYKWRLARNDFADEASSEPTEAT